MKRIILFAAVMLSAAAASAGSRRLPMLYTEERIAAAKRRVEADTTMAAAWGDIRRTADGLLEKNDIRKLEYLALAWRMTGDTRYADKAREIMLDAAKASSWGDSEMLARTPAWRSELQTAHKSFQVAVAYDAVYDRLSASDRKTIAEGMYRLALEPLMGDWLNEPTRIHSLNSMGHNWWTSCACMGGLLSIAFRDELPEAAAWAETLNEALPEWFDFEGDVLQRKPKTFDEAGGMYESLNYANFGIQEALIFRLAWLDTHPGQTAEPIRQLDRLPAYFMHVCYPRTGMLYDLNFGDSHKNVTAESSMMMLYALGIRNEDMLWYFTQVEPGQHRDGFFLNRPMGFLFTPDLSRAPATPSLGLSQLFSDFGWATMRTSWEKDATMLAAKSGFTWNHSHADANSFILFHKGVDIIKDAGNSWYAHPLYRNYFFQSEAHNVVLVDGRGQSREQQYHGSPLRGGMHHLLDAGDIRYVLADGTGPTADLFSRNFRHFLWIGDVILIIDDLKSHEAGEYQWLWHPGGKAVKRGCDLTVTEGEASVVIRPLWPQQLAQSDFVHDYPEALWWEQIEVPDETVKQNETYWSFHLPAKTDRVKGVTAIILKDSPGQKTLPTIERRDGRNWTGLRIVDKGRVTDLYINQLADGRLMHMNSWIEADGWTTDAYMFAVRYDEGASPASADETFVCYGSSLRRDGEVWFSSLSKLFAVSRTGSRKADITIDGQPRVNARIRMPKKPAELRVNGKSSPVAYEDGCLRVKYLERR